MAETSNTPDMLDEFEEEKDVVPFEMIGRAIWLLAKILVPLLIGAVVIGTIFFDFKLAVLASFMGFTLMMFIGLPLVLATYEDEVISEGHD